MENKFKKSEIAEKLYGLTGLYQNFIVHHFQTKIEKPDFSQLDTILSLEQKQDSSIETPIIKQNQNEKSEKNETSAILSKKRAIIELSAEISRCTNCSLCKKPIVPGFGNPDAKILVISDAITVQEEKSMSPLVGEVGVFFKKWLSAIHIDPSEIFITSLIKCNPAKTTVSKEHIEQCIKHLDKQIHCLQPLCILVLGDVVFSSLCKKFIDLNTHHGKIFYYLNIPFIPTYHPALVLKNESLKKSVWNDLKVFENYYQSLV